MLLHFMPNTNQACLFVPALVHSPYQDTTHWTSSPHYPPLLQIHPPFNTSLDINPYVIHVLFPMNTHSLQTTCYTMLLFPPTPHKQHTYALSIFHTCVYVFVAYSFTGHLQTCHKKCLKHLNSFCLPMSFKCTPSRLNISSASSPCFTNNLYVCRNSTFVLLAHHLSNNLFAHFTTLPFSLLSTKRGKIDDTANTILCLHILAIQWISASILFTSSSGLEPPARSLVPIWMSTRASLFISFTWNRCCLRDRSTVVPRWTHTFRCVTHSANPLHIESVRKQTSKPAMKHNKITLKFYCTSLLHKNLSVFFHSCSTNLGLGWYSFSQISLDIAFPCLHPNPSGFFPNASCTARPAFFKLAKAIPCLSLPLITMATISLPPPILMTHQV